MEQVYKRKGFIIYKLIPCLIITMFAFMCLFGSYVCATDVTFADDNLDVTFTNVNLPYDSYAVFVRRSSDYDVYYIYSWDSSTSKLLYRLSSSGNTSFKCVDSSNNKTSYYYCAVRSDQSFDCSTREFTLRDSSVTQSYPYYCLYTNTNIYDYDNPNEVVFQAPPQQVEGLGIIAEKTQGVEMNKILQEIVAILPVVLLVIVGILAIRKAIMFLIQLLKHQ